MKLTGRVFCAALLLAVPVILSSQTVPDFSLKMVNGSVFKLGEHLNKKAVVIEFWASWCKPCKKLLTRMNRIYLENRENLLVLAISTDDASAISTIRSLVRGKNYQFTVLLDPDSRVSRLLNPSLRIPFTIVMDQNRKIRYTHTGYIAGMEKEILRHIEMVLNET